MRYNKKNVQKWINALRSGKYDQSKFVLQNANGFCCLGVACSMFVPKKKIELTSGGFLFGGVASDQDHAPDWLRDVNTDFRLKTGKFLSDLNDSGQFSFDEIADLLQAVYIEKVLG